MDNKKILLVNLSKGKMGELNSKLLGMIFVMKFQAAAMGRVDTPEDQRQDFSLYVDEFQNFATDSFESILSEARKFRLNLIVGNQFMTQLTDKIREAIIGNVGTVICARIGTTDAELMVKKFAPTFDAEDLMKLPNYESITSVMINGVPSAPFSMSFIPPMGHPNQQLADALRKLSAAKYGRDRNTVEQEIFKRLRAGQEAKEQEKQKRLDAMRNSQLRMPGSQSAPSRPGAAGGSSFLDDWLAKRQRTGTPGVTPSQSAQNPSQSPWSKPSPSASVSQPGIVAPTPLSQPSATKPITSQPQPKNDVIDAQLTEAREQAQPQAEEKAQIKKQSSDELRLADAAAGEEVTIQLR